eukprot:8554931-Alexandrium_andersonii.AAC.1
MCIRDRAPAAASRVRREHRYGLVIYRTVPEPFVPNGCEDNGRGQHLDSSPDAGGRKQLGTPPRAPRSRPRGRRSRSA